MLWQNSVFLLICSIVLNLISCSILRTKFSKNELNTGADLHAFNAFSSVMSMLTLIAVCVFSKTLGIPSVYTLCMGIIFGIVTAVCAVLSIRALEIGPMSYTTVICYCSMLIPSLSGMILYDEKISVIQYIGIAFMLASFVCAVDKKNDKSGASAKWFLFCMGAFVTSGAVGVMQKVHQNSDYNDELGVFLVIAFGVSALFSFIICTYLRHIKKQPLTVHLKQKKGKYISYSIICGIGIALVNQINMYLAGAMQSIIFYPVFNGSMIILTSVIGVIFWKERLSVKQWAGLVTGIVATMLLCIG